MEFGFGMGIGVSFSHPLPSPSASVHPTNTPPYLYGLPSADTLRIDDLLDFSNHDVFSSSSASSAAAVPPDAHILPHQSGFSYNSHSHFHSHASSFADEIYIPSEEAAELEWLSKFVEDSFTDAPYPSNYLPPPAQIENADYPTTAASTGRGARSKWSRNLQVTNQPSSSTSTSSSSSSDFTQQTLHSIDDGRNRDGGDRLRRCSHCGSEKTPQWRTGPLGPKTLCNACGVRFKSGRLVPEYRPAASPTFVLMQHSNSHRKVMELRRQKEQLRGMNHSSY